jgi:hypothetical protein
MRMNYTLLRIERLTRELCEEMSLEYGTEQAARMLEQAALDIRTAKGARSTRSAERAFALARSALTSIPASDDPRSRRSDLSAGAPEAPYSGADGNAALGG